MKGISMRNEIDEQDKWNTAAIYAEESEWDADLQTLRAMSEQVGSYRGTLGRDVQSLLAFLKFEEKLSRLLDRVYLYAAMKQDEDNSNPLYQGKKQQVQSVAVEISAAASFVQPELLAIPAATLALWLQNPELAVYNRYFYLVERQKEHTGSQREEEIIALSGEVCGAPHAIFNMLNNVDLSFPTIPTKDGEQQLSHGNYTLFLESSDRAVRRAAFEALYSSYEKNINTFGALQAANIKKDIYIARVRNFPSSLAASLYEEEIPVQVYDNLITAVHEHLPLFHRYMELRRRALGVEELHLYDIYVPLTKDEPQQIPYAQAKEMVLEGLDVLGDDYLDIVRRAYDNRWIDVYENQNKTPGAYSSGIYDSVPYMLLNYQSNLNSVFTLAHEMGHSMHSYFTNQTQPYIYSNYEIFVAEVASTVNETLLLLHLLENETDKQRRLQLICYYLDEFRGTVYRQTMFAEFERKAHNHAESGEPVNNDYFNSMYYDLNQQYFGSNMVVDEAIKLEWARIPHFYRSFYVYKYATGFAAASALAGTMHKEGKGSPSVARYREFLTQGCATDPLNLLAHAGVDMSQPQALNAAFEVFEGLVEQLEALL